MAFNGHSISQAQQTASLGGLPRFATRHLYKLVRFSHSRLPDIDLHNSRAHAEAAIDGVSYSVHGSFGSDQAAELQWGMAREAGLVLRLIDTRL